MPAATQFAHRHLEISERAAKYAVPEDKPVPDYFQDSVLSNLKTLTAQYEAAVAAAGAVLSDEDRQNIDDYIGNYKSYAESNNLSLNKFLAANYGRGATEKSVRRLLEMSYIGSAYAQSIYDSGSYTDEELESYYQEHADRYDEIDYLTVLLERYPGGGRIPTGMVKNEEANGRGKGSRHGTGQETSRENRRGEKRGGIQIPCSLEKTLSDAPRAPTK
jgi:hypothetical protein